VPGNVVDDRTFSSALLLRRKLDNFQLSHLLLADSDDDSRQSVIGDDMIAFAETSHVRHLGTLVVYTNQ